MMSSLVSGLIPHVRHRVLEYGRDGEKVSAPYAYYIDAYNGARAVAASSSPKLQVPYGCRNNKVFILT